MAVTSTTIFDSFFTSTTTKFQKTLEKNFIEHRPSVKVLMDDYGHKESGGYQVQIPLEFGSNTNTKFFNPYDAIDTTPAEYALPVIFPWRHVASSATISEIEVVANSGKEKLFDLFEGRVRQAVRSMVNLLGSEIYSDGTSFGGNTIVGLAAGISTTPATGSVGGIDPASYFFWRNNATTSCGSFAAYGVNGTTGDLVETMYNTCTDGMTDAPTARLSAQNVYEFYNRSLLSTVQYTDPNHSKTGDLSFNGLRYKGLTWYWDRQCPAGRAYTLSNSAAHFYIDPQMMFTWTEPRSWPNQLTKTRLLALRCALVYKRRMFLGVEDGWTA